MNPADFDIDAHCDTLAKAGTEHAHQRAFFAWLSHMALIGRYPWARVAFAVPNGGKRDMVTASRLKAEGVKAGVPDVIYPARSGAYLGLKIEMKVPPHGAASPAQKLWHADLRTLGHAVAVCWSWRAAKQCFEDYCDKGSVQEDYR